MRYGWKLNANAALDIEGIFRVSGLASDIDKLLKQFESGGALSLFIVYSCVQCNGWA
jgi:hypothetical protein